MLPTWQKISNHAFGMNDGTGSWAIWPKCLLNRNSPPLLYEEAFCYVSPHMEFEGVQPRHRFATSVRTRPNSKEVNNYKMTCFWSHFSLEAWPHYSQIVQMAFISVTWGWMHSTQMSGSLGGQSGWKNNWHFLAAIDSYTEGSIFDLELGVPQTSWGGY